MITKLKKHQIALIRKLARKHPVRDVRIILINDYNLILPYRTVQYWCDPIKGRKYSNEKKKGYYAKKMSVIECPKKI